MRRVKKACVSSSADSLLVVDAAVQGDVDAEGQESDAASLSHTLLATERQAVAELVAEDVRQERRCREQCWRLTVTGEWSCRRGEDRNYLHRAFG